MTETPEIWVYLSQTPLLWLTVTLIAYGAGYWCFVKSGANPVVNPVAVATLLLMGILIGTGTSYEAYFDGAQFVHFMLGPATVALALPMLRHLPRVRVALVPLLAALIAGAVTAVLSALAVAAALGASRETLLSLAPKSVTTPIAMGISEAVGGLPSLTASLVIATGILGAVLATPILNLIGVRDWRARGFATGVAAHGIGTARAFQVNQLAGVFAAIGMGMNGIATSLIVPLAASLL
ncbi:MAG: putative murein hydrolase (TIGR00659 family) [Paracoccaceae bacterium]|jgi:predicted murein hydrolase (TIGR00659 family)